VDKYLIHLRKLKHLKNEVVKANMAAAAAAKEKEAQDAKNKENGVANAKEVDTKSQAALSGKSKSSFNSDNKEEGAESMACKFKFSV
jgi:hypothetical protein